MDLKRRKLTRDYNNLDFDFRYKELKQSFMLQKQKWLKVSELNVQFA
jgi:stearoyl-CoA desaturase (delta-9 desaturase)